MVCLVFGVLVFDLFLLVGDWFVLFCCFVVECFVWIVALVLMCNCFA